MNRIAASGDNIQKHYLPFSVKFVFAIGSFGPTILVSAISFFLLFFYTDVMLVPPALASTALLVSKIWDIVNDPLFGWISDRTQSKHGRRRVFLIYGAFPLAITSFLLWAMPKGLSTGWAFAWIAISYILFDTFFTITNVPLSAMAPELAKGYDQRTDLMTFTSFGAILGYIAGSVMMPTIVGGFEDVNQGYLVAGAIFGAIVGTSIAIVAWKIKEPGEGKRRSSGLPLFEALRSTFRNGPFMLLMIAFALARLSFTLLSAVAPYFITYQLGAPDRVRFLIFIMLIVIGVCVFLWKRIANRWSKGIAYASGLAIVAVSVGISFFIQTGQMGFAIPVFIVTGIGLSAHWVIPWAMIPDVIEYDQVKTGERREGMFYGVYGLIDKISRTLGIVTIGWMLDAYGYIPNVEQTTRSLLGIRLMFGPISAGLLLLAVPFLLLYPITRDSHANVRRQLGDISGEQHGATKEDCE